MIFEEVPVFNDPFQKIDIVIGGLAYTVKLRWNYSFKFWAMDMLTRDLDVVLQGVKLVKNHPLIHTYGLTGLPVYGDLIVADYGHDGDEPGIGNLGNRFKMMYVDWTDDELRKDAVLAEAVRSGSIWDHGESIWDGLSAVWVE